MIDIEQAESCLTVLVEFCC